MDRIESQGLLQSFLPSKTEEKKSKKTQTAKKTGFLSALSQAQDTERTGQLTSTDISGEDDLEKLLDEVQESGRHLVAYPGPENVQAYKERVRRFIKQVLKRSVTLSEVEGRLRKDMKRPKYLLLQVIDEKLEKLGAYILTDQKDKLEILRKVDELHGLLIDLQY